MPLFFFKDDGFTGFYWVFSGFYRVSEAAFSTSDLPSFTEFYRVLWSYPGCIFFKDNGF